MSNALRWMVLENIAILFAICFLCWLFGSGWPCLFAVCLKIFRKRKDRWTMSEDKALYACPHCGTVYYTTATHDDGDARICLRDECYSGPFYLERINFPPLLPDPKEKTES